MVRFLLFLISDTDVPHRDQRGGVTKEPLKEHYIVVGLVVEISEGLPQCVGANILLQSTGFGSSFQNLPQSVNLNMIAALTIRDVVITNVPHPICTLSILSGLKNVYVLTERWTFYWEVPVKNLHA